MRYLLVSLFALTLVAATVFAQAPAPAPAQGAAPAGGGRGAPPPPARQPGHGTGKLVIWGDTALFDGRLNPENCLLMSRFKRGMRLGFRMTAIDGGTGETENTAVITGHLTYNSKTKGKLTVDIPMRYRATATQPERQFWVAKWVVPQDAPVGVVRYTVTATDKYGRQGSFKPFEVQASQLTVVE